MRQLNLIMLFEMRPAQSWDICRFLPFHRPDFSSILKCHEQAQSQTVTVLVTKWFYKRDEINLDSNCPKNDRLCLFYHKKIKLKLWSLLLPNFILVPNRREVALTQASCIFPVVQCSLLCFMTPGTIFEDEREGERGRKREKWNSVEGQAENYPNPTIFILKNFVREV